MNKDLKTPKERTHSIDTQKIIDRCRVLIKDYAERSTTMTGDDLLLMNDKLSVAYSYLGEREAEMNRNASFAYSNRLQVKASRIVKQIAAGEKITAAKDTSENDGEVQSARFDEIIDSYLAENVQNLLRSISKVLSAVDRRLQFIAQDKRLADKNPIKK